jgi:hypothetical protein
MTIDDIVNHLRSAFPSWDVPLTQGGLQLVCLTVFDKLDIKVEGLWLGDSGKRQVSLYLPDYRTLLELKSIGGRHRVSEAMVQLPAYAKRLAKWYGIEGPITQIAVFSSQFEDPDQAKRLASAGIRFITTSAPYPTA